MRSIGWLAGIAVVAIVVAIALGPAREGPVAVATTPEPRGEIGPRGERLVAPSAEEPLVEAAGASRRIPPELVAELARRAPIQGAVSGVDRAETIRRIEERGPLPPQIARPIRVADQHRAMVDAWRDRVDLAATNVAAEIAPAHEERIVGIVGDYVDRIAEARSALFAGEVERTEYSETVKAATLEAQREIARVTDSPEQADEVWKAVREASSSR